MNEIANRLRNELLTVAAAIEPNQASLKSALGQLSRVVIETSWALTCPADQAKLQLGSDKIRPSERYLLKVVGCDTNSSST